MKQLVNSLGMAIIIFLLLATTSCSKKGDIVLPKVDPIPSKALVFTSEPKLLEDTLDYKSGGTIKFSALNLISVSATIGIPSADKSSIAIPAGINGSTSTKITFTGEDGKSVDRIVPLPMYDSDFSTITKGESKWKMIYNVMSWDGGSINGVISSDLWSFSKEMVSTGNGRKAYKNGVLNSNELGWQHRANPNGSGTQYWDGLIWSDNSFSPDGNEWTIKSYQTVSGVVYTFTIKCHKQ